MSAFTQGFIIMTLTIISVCSIRILIEIVGMGMVFRKGLSAVAKAIEFKVKHESE